MTRTGAPVRPDSGGAPAPAAPAVASSGRRRERLIELAWLGGTMLAALAAAALVLRLWDADMQVPLGGSNGDSVFSMMVIKDVLTSSWFQHNDQLGVPFGQQLLDFPVYSVDNLQFALIKAFTPVSTSVAAVINAYFLLTFPLTAGAAFLALRALGISRAAAAACGVLFATAPYHFLRGQPHLFLSGYFSVPAGAYLFLTIARGRSPFTRRARAGRIRPWLTPRTLATLGCCVVIGSAGVYYAAFTLLVLVGLVPLTALAGKDRRQLAWAAAVVALIGGTLALNLAPNVVHRLAHGANEQVAKRDPVESEIFSLNITQLVLPIERHRVGALAEIRERYASQAPLPGERAATLGTIAMLGLLGGVVLALSGRGLRGRWRLARSAGLASLACVLIGTTGGISALIAFNVSSQLRGWGRISIFVAFFSLVVVAVAFDRLVARARPARRGRIAAGAAAALTLVGVLDQTSPSYAPNYAQARAEWSSDARFVRAIEARLPAGAAVFQLPYMPFPEVQPINGMVDYDPARGYLHSHRLGFSYGALKGRPADWSDALAEQPAARVVPSVAAAGFAGLWLDRAGYADHGAAVERQLTTTVGSGPTAVSENDRFAFFDLRRYEAALRARSAAALRALGRTTLRPVRIRWPRGFHAAESAAGTAYWRWMTATGQLTLENPGSAPRRVRFSARATTGKRATVTVRWPDGSVERRRTGARPLRLSRALRLPPGVSTVTLTTDAAPTPTRAPDKRDLRLQLSGTTVTDSAADPLLSPR